jgi:hypothetical protein
VGKWENTRGINVYVRFNVFTAVTMKNAVFWDVSPCRSCVNRRFGGICHLHIQGRKIRERETSVNRWLQAESPVENTKLYKNMEGEWASGKSIEGRGERYVEMGQLVAGQSRYRIVPHRRRRHSLINVQVNS